MKSPNLNAHKDATSGQPRERGPSLLELFAQERKRGYDEGYKRGKDDGELVMLEMLGGDKPISKEEAEAAAKRGRELLEAAKESAEQRRAVLRDAVALLRSLGKEGAADMLERAYR